MPQPHRVTHFVQIGQKGMIAGRWLGQVRPAIWHRSYADKDVAAKAGPRKMGKGGVLPTVKIGKPDVPGISLLARPFGKLHVDDIRKCRHDQPRCHALIAAKGRKGRAFGVTRIIGGNNVGKAEGQAVALPGTILLRWLDQLVNDLLQRPGFRHGGRSCRSPKSVARAGLCQHCQAIVCR